MAPELVDHAKSVADPGSWQPVKAKQVETLERTGSSQSTNPVKLKPRELGDRSFL